MLFSKTHPLHTLKVSMLLLSAIAWYALTVGINDITHGEIPFALALVLAGTVQALLAVAALHIIPGRSSLRVWPFLMIILVVMLLISVTFSTAFYFKLFSAQSFGESLFEKQYKKVMADASLLHDSYYRLAVQVDNLAETSDRLARQEENKGGTCKINKGGKAGPYTYKRRYQKAVFSELARQFNDKKKRLESILSDMEKISLKNGDGESIPFVQRLNRLASGYNQLKAIYSDSVNSVYRELIESHLKYESEGFPIGDPRYTSFAGKENACDDDRTKAKLGSVLAIKMPPPPDYQLKTINPADNRQIVELVVQSVAALFANDEENQTLSIFNREYSAGIAAGFMIESVIILLGLVVQVSSSHTEYPADRQKLVTLFNRLFSISNLYPSLGIDTASRNLLTIGGLANWLHEFIRKTGIEAQGETYLFVPEDSSGAAKRRTEKGRAFAEFSHDVMDILKQEHFVIEESGHYTEFMGVNLDEHKHHFGVDDDDFPVNSPFMVYKIDPALFAIIRKYLADDTRLDRDGSPLQLGQPSDKSNTLFGPTLALVLKHSASSMAEYLIGRITSENGHNVFVMDEHSEADRLCLQWMKKTPFHVEPHDLEITMKILLFLQGKDQQLIMVSDELLDHIRKHL